MVVHHSVLLLVLVAQAVAVVKIKVVDQEFLGKVLREALALRKRLEVAEAQVP
jgi:hypothetical protein